MDKKKITVEGSKSTADALEQLREVADQFRPSTAQKKAKAAFWVNWQEDPQVEPELMDKQQAALLSGTPLVERWWSQPGFREWFINRQEHKHRLEYLYDLALERAEKILLAEDPKMASAQVNVIKAVADLGSKFPGREGVTGDMASWLKAINSMDAVQLKALFEKEGAKAGLFIEKPSKELAAPQKVLDKDEEVE